MPFCIQNETLLPVATSLAVLADRPGAVEGGANHSLDMGEDSSLSGQCKKDAQAILALCKIAEPELLTWVIL